MNLGRYGQAEEVVGMIRFLVAGLLLTYTIHFINTDIYLLYFYCNKSP